MAKIIIVDDHPVTRDGLSMRINRESDLEVCGEAEDINDAMQVIASTNPDLAVIDVSLRTSSGIELVKEVKSRFPGLRMLVWSMYEEGLYAERALQAGASGYLNKRHVRETLIEAIRTVLAGNVYLSPEFAKKVLNRLQSGRSSTLEIKSPTVLLSDRELEAFTLIGHGLKTAEVARRMEVATKTIETYRTRIKEKLQLQHSGELSRVAIQWVLENG